MKWDNKMKTKKDRQPKARFKYRCSVCTFIATAVKEKDIKDGEPCWQPGCKGKMKKVGNESRLL